jgi:hypothetical protein
MSFEQELTLRWIWKKVDLIFDGGGRLLFLVVSIFCIEFPPSFRGGFDILMCAVALLSGFWMGASSHDRILVHARAYVGLGILVDLGWSTEAARLGGYACEMLKACACHTVMSDAQS